MRFASFVALFGFAAAVGCSLDDGGVGSTFGGSDGFDGSVDDAALQDDTLVTTGDAPASDDGSAGLGDASDAGAGDDGQALDATTKRDATGDSSLPDAKSDAATGCATGYRCDTPSGGFVCVTDCVACGNQTGKALACAATKSCVADCASCADAGVECYSCGPSGTGTPVGSCDRACLSGAYDHCTDCNSLGCPGDKQVCYHVHGGTFDCRTCGESNTINGGCSGAGQCTSTQVCN